MKTHLIMPMCGAGSRFFKNGYSVPKPLIEIENKPFFYWATRSIEKYVELKDISFIILQEHVDYFDLDKRIRQFYPKAKIVVIPHITAGPVFTCLEGVRNIKDGNPVIFNDCDHMFKSESLYKLMQGKEDAIDGALVTFYSDAPHFSFVKYDKQEKIIGTVEKEVVSNHAICGAYYFKSAQLFRIIADEYIKTCPYKETFISGMYNTMCQKGMKIKDYLLDFHLEFGTPEEFEKAKGSTLFKELL